MGQSYSKPKEVESVHYAGFEAAMPDLTGKTIVITGTTSGTGYVAARACARKGAHVVMLNRTSARAEAAATRIAEEAPGGSVETVECDLMSFASVRAAAATLNAKFGAAGIDVLCHNAGVMALADSATGDGHDVQMQTNHLSPFLLTREVFGCLVKASELRGESRIVNHSSLARHGGALQEKYFGKNGGNLGGNGASMVLGGARWVRYHQTKMANAVWTAALAKRLAGSKVKATVAAPGFAATNLQVTTQADGGFSMNALIGTLMQSAEDGALPLLTCCVGAEVNNGDFFEPEGRTACYGKPFKKPLEAACTAAAAQTLLWEASEAACGAWAL